MVQGLRPALTACALPAALFAPQQPVEFRKAAKFFDILRQQATQQRRQETRIGAVFAVNPRAWQGRG